MNHQAPLIKVSDALFLDFDGTIVEIVDTPSLVRVGSNLPGLLELTSTRLGGAVAVISGRPRADLLRLLHPYQGAAAGIHGIERKTADNVIIRPSPESWIGRARPILEAFACKSAGVTLEDKKFALALHFRANPELAPICVETAYAVAKASSGRLAVMKGKMVVELHPRSMNKGRAILDFLHEAPFCGRRPIFAGDDRTDEDGFVVVNRLGGISISVGTPISTSAKFNFPDVASVIAWLSEFASPPHMAELAPHSPT